MIFELAIRRFAALRTADATGNYQIAGALSFSGSAANMLPASTVTDLIRSLRLMAPSERAARRPRRDPFSQESTSAVQSAGRGGRDSWRRGRPFPRGRRDTTYPAAPEASSSAQSIAGTGPAADAAGPAHR